jgi:hypothetical protein
MAISSGSWQAWPDGDGEGVADGDASGEAVPAGPPVLADGPAEGDAPAGPPLDEGADGPGPPGPALPPCPLALGPGATRGASLAQSVRMTVAPSVSALPPMPPMSTK